MKNLIHKTYRLIRGSRPNTPKCEIGIMADYILTFILFLATMPLWAAIYIADYFMSERSEPEDINIYFVAFASLFLDAIFAPIIKELGISLAFIYIAPLAGFIIIIVAALIAAIFAVVISTISDFILKKIKC